MSDNFRGPYPNTVKLLIQDLLIAQGVHDTISVVVNALQGYANDMSDMGLKEKAIQAANMADVLQDINGD